VAQQPGGGPPLPKDEGRAQDPENGQGQGAQLAEQTMRLAFERAAALSSAITLASKRNSMSSPVQPIQLSQDSVLSVILGGGAGTRLFPLTKERAKPAVPLAGKYRLVDIPISNCINSGLKRIYLLTQFNSASLHRHVTQSFKFDQFSSGFVEILAAEQTLTDTSWYQGTADAVRKNLIHLMNHKFDYLIVLSGDQLYRMDFRAIIVQHVASAADITVATIPVERRDVPGFGIMQMDEDFRITRFVEKPKDPAVQETLKLPHEWYSRLNIDSDKDLFLASMGIYVFNRELLAQLLNNDDHTDFGKHIIPESIKTRRVYSYVFQGYWEDIGTIRAFFEANLELAALLPRFNFFDMSAPIFTRPRFLPSSKINGGTIEQALISDGCIVNRATIRNSLVGLRSLVDEGTYLNRVILMGCDAYESAESIATNLANGQPKIGVGRNCRIENAIIDKNARIGDNCSISPEGKPGDVDHPMYYIRDGIVIIPKNACIRNGTVI
jgi:glucose-1-phosphate adenylyltransferase